MTCCMRPCHSDGDVDFAHSSAAGFDATSPVSSVYSIRQRVVTAYRCAQAISKLVQLSRSGTKLSISVGILLRRTSAGTSATS